MKRFTGTILFCFFAVVLHAQQITLSKQMANTAMNLWKDSFAIKEGKPARWSYDQGVILKGIEAVWKLYGDGKAAEFICAEMKENLI